MTRHRNGGLKKRCGCPRRTWAKCPHPWHFGYYHNGREHRYSLSQIARARGDTVPTSKTEAKILADRLRGEIRAGKNPNARLAQQSSPDVRLTFGDVSDRYLDEYVRVQSRKIDAQRVRMFHVNALKRAFVPAATGTRIALERKSIDEITRADIEVLRNDWLEHRPGRKGGRVGANRLLARLRHLFRWAIVQGYVDHTPFQLHGVPAIKLDGRAEGPRTRRLEDGEEERLVRTRRRISEISSLPRSKRGVAGVNFSR